MSLHRIRPEDKSQEWRPRKSVRLYLGDLEAILAVMRQIETEVRVRAGDFAGTIAKAEDLKEAGPGSLEPLELQAGVDDRMILVRLSPPVGVRVPRRDDYHLVGTGQTIHEILTDCHTRTGGWPPGSADREGSWLLVVVFGILFSGSVAAAILRVFVGGDASRIPFALLGAVITALVVFIYVTHKAFFGTNSAPSAKIVLAYRADAPTWWERNRTPVLIGLTTNFVSAAVFFLLGLWVA